MGGYAVQLLRRQRHAWQGFAKQCSASLRSSTTAQSIRAHLPSSLTSMPNAASWVGWTQRLSHLIERLEALDQQLRKV
jgi:hypothetical protein